MIWFPVVAALVLGLLLLRAAGVGGLRGAPSRLVLLRSGLDGVVVLVVARVLTPWGAVPAWAWWPPAVLVVAGVVAVVLRAPALPLLDPARGPKRQIGAAAAEGVAGVAVLGLVLL